MDLQLAYIVLSYLLFNDISLYETFAFIDMILFLIPYSTKYIPLYSK